MINKDKFNLQISFLREQKQVILTLIFSAFIIDTIFVPKSSDFIVFGLLVLYILSIWIYKLKSRVSIIFCFIFISIMYLSFLISGSSDRTEKAAVWLFFFFLINIVQQFKE
ncbi:hypothetical protein C4559_02120 [Candidatus Microgenomates bacterium]|nr:MAG: hypothetical protein C4559_02120 [Candidatus Microgenomates bacterium]